MTIVLLMVALILIWAAWELYRNREKPKPVQDDPLDQRVMSVFLCCPRLEFTIDHFVESFKLESWRILDVLTRLEAHGSIRRTEKGTYRFYMGGSSGE